MTLGTWFKDYVYIPLGGNRVKLGRWIFNTAVVWALTGLWHGAAWNFVVWGMMFAVLLVAEKFLLNKFLAKIPSFFSHIYLLFVIMISFIIFNAGSMTEALGDIKGLFGGGLPLSSFEAVYTLKSYFILIAVSVIGATPALKICTEKLRSRKASAMVMQIAEPIAMIALLLICTAFLVDGSFNPFLYFRF